MLHAMQCSLDNLLLYDYYTNCLDSNVYLTPILGYWGYALTSITAIFYLGVIYKAL